MKGVLINISLSFLLVGCYPCRFLDWNCNNHDTVWHRNSNRCMETQTNIAKKKLNDKFNRNIHIRIINQCIDDSDYKFEQDLKYLNYQQVLYL